MKRIITYLGPMILLGTLLVSVPRYASAFVQAEPPLFGWPTAPVTGLGFGLLLELGIYYVIDSWFDARRRGLKLHWLLLAGVGAQLVLGPIIVAPAIVGHLRSQPGELGAVLVSDLILWGWAVVVAAAPALLLAAVAAASYLREPVSRKEPEKPGIVQEHPVSIRRWPDKAAFLADPDRPRGVTSGRLAEMAGIDDRRARRWLAADRNPAGRGNGSGGPAGRDSGGN